LGSEGFQSLGFRVEGFRIWVLRGFRVEGLGSGFRVWVRRGFRVEGLGSGFRVWVRRDFRVSGLGGRELWRQDSTLPHANGRIIGFGLNRSDSFRFWWGHFSTDSDRFSLFRFVLH
jgi:hypothetical protein